MSKRTESVVTRIPPCNTSDYGNFPLDCPGRYRQGCSDGGDPGRKRQVPVDNCRHVDNRVGTAGVFHDGLPSGLITVMKTMRKFTAPVGHAAHAAHATRATAAAGIALLASLGLAACGNDDDGGSGTGSSSTAVSTTQDAAPRSGEPTVTQDENGTKVDDGNGNTASIGEDGIHTGSGDGASADVNEDGSVHLDDGNGHVLDTGADSQVSDMLGQLGDLSGGGQ
jgi:hypothetical protein